MSKNRRISWRSRDWRCDDCCRLTSWRKRQRNNKLNEESAKRNVQLNKLIAEKFLILKLQKQGAQQQYSDVFKPITYSTNKVAETIVKTRELATKNLDEKLENFPDVLDKLKTLDEILKNNKNSLDTQVKTDGVTEEIKDQLHELTKPQITLEKLSKVLDKQPQLAKIIEISDSNPRIEAAVAGEDVELTRN